MFEHDPDFKQGQERARIFYDEGLVACIDIYIAATLAMAAHMPEQHPELCRVSMKNAIDRIPDRLIGKRP